MRKMGGRNNRELPTFMAAVAMSISVGKRHFVTLVPYLKLLPLNLLKLPESLYLQEALQA
jgi:hypothetical protein